ncbi:MAG: hypothetical protein ACI8WW_001931 [Oceanospirillaceae bacterium]|jgi:hypothetical protein
MRSGTYGLSFVFPANAPGEVLRSARISISQSPDGFYEFDFVNWFQQIIKGISISRKSTSTLFDRKKTSASAG